MARGVACVGLSNSGLTLATALLLAEDSPLQNLEEGQLTNFVSQDEMILLPKRPLQSLQSPIIESAFSAARWASDIEGVVTAA